jgi:hypothetical protein
MDVKKRSLTARQQGNESSCEEVLLTMCDCCRVDCLPVWVQVCVVVRGQQLEGGEQGLGGHNAVQLCLLAASTATSTPLGTGQTCHRSGTIEVPLCAVGAAGDSRSCHRTVIVQNRVSQNRAITVQASGANIWNEQPS